MTSKERLDEALDALDSLPDTDVFGREFIWITATRSASRQPHRWRIVAKNWDMAYRIALANRINNSGQTPEEAMDYFMKGGDELIEIGDRNDFDPNVPQMVQIKDGEWFDLREVGPNQALINDELIEIEGEVTDAPYEGYLKPGPRNF